MKFSIRDMLLVTVIVALAVGWWVDNRIKAAREREIAKSKEFVEWKLRALAELIEREPGHKVIDGDGFEISLTSPATSPAGAKLEASLENV